MEDIVIENSKVHHITKASIVLGNSVVTCMHTCVGHDMKGVCSVDCSSKATGWEATRAVGKVLQSIFKCLISASVLQTATCVILAKDLTLAPLLPSTSRGAPLTSLPLK